MLKNPINNLLMEIIETNGLKDKFDYVVNLPCFQAVSINSDYIRFYKGNEIVYKIDLYENEHMRVLVLLPLWTKLPYKEPKETIDLRKINKYKYELLDRYKKDFKINTEYWHLFDNWTDFEVINYLSQFYDFLYYPNGYEEWLDTCGYYEAERVKNRYK